MSIWNKIRKELQDNREIYKWVAIVVLSFLLFLWVLFFTRDRYSATLNMGWMLIYSLLEHLWSHIWVLVIIGVILYFFRTFWDKYWIFIVLIAFLYFALATPESLRKYSLNNKRQFFAEILLNEMKDIWAAEYEVLLCEDCELVNEHFVINGRGRRSEYTYYYISVNGGDYVLPIPVGYGNYVSKLLKTEKGIYEIKLYSNTKFIVEINGIPLNEMTTERLEAYKTEQRTTQCTINITEDSRIKVTENTDASEWDYRSISYFNPDKRMVFSIVLNEDEDYPFYRREDGTWCIFVTNRSFECVSNIFLYDVMDGEITNIRSGDISILDDYLPPKS